MIVAFTASCISPCDYSLTSTGWVFV